MAAFGGVCRGGRRKVMVPKRTVSVTVWLCWEAERTHGREFFAGRRQRDCLSRFSVHLFRLEVSKQNGVSFHRLRSSSSGIHAALD